MAFEKTEEGRQRFEGEIIWFSMGRYDHVWRLGEDSGRREHLRCKSVRGNAE